jgi:hypothetical protein
MECLEQLTRARQAGNGCGGKLELKAGQRQMGETNSISSSIPHGEARNSFLRNDGIVMIWLIMGLDVGSWYP